MPCRGVGRKKERKAHLERIQATTITPRTEVSPSTHAPSAKLGAPFLPHQHTRPFFFFSSFIDLNSFSASNTRNRPTFSHPLLCGRLIFGHLRSIGDHFWENKAPFQVGGLATRAHLDHQRRSEQGGAAPPLVWAQRVGWGGVELGSPAHQTEKLILQHQYWRGDAEGLVCGCRAQQQLGR